MRDIYTIQYGLDNSPSKLRTAIRKLANNGHFCAPYPVVVVPGTFPPVVRGEPWHYTNRSGELIRHPSAYANRGWSSMVYRYSTMRVEVGVCWIVRYLAKNHPEVLALYTVHRLLGVIGERNKEKNNE